MLWQIQLFYFWWFRIPKSLRSSLKIVLALRDLLSSTLLRNNYYYYFYDNVEVAKYSS